MKYTKMAYKNDDVILVLKQVQSLRGDYQGFVKHTDLKDIHKIINGCYILLEDNFDLHVNKKKTVKNVLVFKKEIKTLSMLSHY